MALARAGRPRLLDSESPLTFEGAGHTLAKKQPLLPMYQIQVETFFRLVLVLEVFIQRGSAPRNCPAGTPTVLSESAEGPNGPSKGKKAALVKTG